MVLHRIVEKIKGLLLDRMKPMPDLYIMILTLFLRYYTGVDRIYEVKK